MERVIEKQIIQDRLEAPMPAQSFPMNGGDATYSYANYSQFQKKGADNAKEIVKDAIVEKLEAISSTFRIVDLGCSVGPNTFFTIQNLIESVEKKCSLLGIDSIEFQVFFNDHTDNDFNTLFASIPPDHRQLYYAAGAPGSFYGRIFPRASINLAYSCYALHWLSRVPQELSDSKSTAWNEGKTHYTGSSPQVINAYRDQFEKDMGVFISARGDEIVSGGLMVIIMSGVPDETISHFQGVLFSFYGSILMDMANEGIIDKSEIDAFNIPIYAPTVAEITKVIEKNGYFCIEKIELRHFKSQNSELFNANTWIKHSRAGLGVYNKHFGDAVAEKMFNKIEAKSDEMSHFFESTNFAATHLFIVLKRK